MANTKQFEILFKMNAQIASSFKSGFNNANKSLNDMNKRTEALKKNIAGLQGIAQKGVAFGAVGLAGAGVIAKSAITAESAMAEFGKVLNGTEKELASYRKEFMQLSSQTGMSFEDVTVMGAAAAQAGIAKKEIVQFTQNAIEMGVAFDMAAEDAGQSMAELRVQFKMSQDQVVEFGDKLNYLGNTTPNTSKKLLEVTQRVGSLGKLANLTETHIAALGASVVGMEPDVMATGIKGVIFALSAGTGATKAQREAYSKLGLDASKVNKAMQKDASKTMITVLKAVKSLKKEDQASTLAALFGKEGVGVTSQLVDNLDDVKKNLDAVSEANKSVWKGAMLKEYQERMKTTELAMARAKQSIRNIGIEIGYHFLPYIKQGAEWVSNLSKRISKWTEKNPELTASLAKWGVIIAAVVGGVSALSLGIIAFIGPILVVGKTIGSILGIFGKAITIIKFLGTTFMWLGRIFLMNPIGLIITAIVAAIYILYTNWDTVSKFLVASWDRIKSAWNSGMSAISAFVSEKWESIKGFFNSGIGNITSTILSFSPLGLFYKVFAGVMSYFGVDMPSKFTDFGKFLIQGLINGISSMAGAVIDKAKAIASAVTETVKNAFGIHSPSKVFAQFGAFNMEGLANGMTAGAPMAQKASIEAVSGSMPSATGQSLTSNSTSNSSAFTINLTVNGGGSDTAEQAKSGIMDAMDQIKSMQQRERRLNLA